MDKFEDTLKIVEAQLQEVQGKVDTQVWGYTEHSEDSITEGKERLHGQVWGYTENSGDPITEGTVLITVKYIHKYDDTLNLLRHN